MKTGLVVAPSPGLLGDAMLRLHRDVDLYSRLRSEAMRWSRSLSYDSTATILFDRLAVAVGT